MKALLMMAAAVLGLASLGAAPARAQQNLTDEVFYDFGVRDCPNATSCEVLLDTVTEATEMVKITRVACTITLSNAAKVGDLQLRRRGDGGIVTQQTLAPIDALPTHGTTTRYLVNVPASLALQEGDRPAVYLALRGGAAAVFTLSCSVHGTYREPPL